MQSKPLPVLSLHKSRLFSMTQSDKKWPQIAWLRAKVSPRGEGVYCAEAQQPGLGVSTRVLLFLPLLADGLGMSPPLRVLP